MVIMERGKLPELAAGTSVQEQNTTDEEKSAAATGLESAQWSRCRGRAQSSCTHAGAMGSTGWGAARRPACQSGWGVLLCRWDEEVG